MFNQAIRRFASETIPEGTNCTVSGFGMTSQQDKNDVTPYKTEVQITSCGGSEQTSRICAENQNLSGVLCKVSFHNERYSYECLFREKN